MPVPHNKRSIMSCYCPDCPTYPGGEQPLYCGIGVSPSSLRTHGCICPECPVYIEYGLHLPYFCVLEKASLEQLP